MYNDGDLDAAVSAGILSAEAAAAFRAFAGGRGTAAAVDEEQFRLLTGFNDIFVSIAAVLTLIAVGQLGGRAMAPPALGGLAVAVASWAGAEYFTRVRRMALPSIVLLLGFVGGLFVGLLGIIAPLVAPTVLSTPPLGIAASAALTAAGAYAHWRRFMVPVTVAAGASAALMAAVGLMVGLDPGLVEHWLLPGVLLGGLAIFALALRWDASDRQRRTRRADVAFWLHLAAAPVIVHPIFTLLGILGGDAGPAQAGAAVAIYLALAIIALAIDRRALLVSALAYVLYAIAALFRAAGSLDGSFALTALVIGSALLLLSAFWHPSRRLVLRTLPAAVRQRLPVV